ncbi:hypothetical protein [Polaribacter gochangensis]|uniref:hypothetical protein n=1 Tax=Polaribacter gochangensis TaxID=3252903 RepID=UPI0039048238
MHAHIHKKSLYYSLQENKGKIRQTTKWLIFFSSLISVVLLVLAFLFFDNEYTYIIALISGYVIYLGCTIFSLWHIRKKIKEKLKTLK